MQFSWRKKSTKPHKRENSASDDVAVSSVLIADWRTDGRTRRARERERRRESDGALALQRRLDEAKRVRASKLGPG